MDWKKIANDMWEGFGFFLEFISKKLYKYSFVMGIVVGFYNTYIGTLFLILLITGFFNREIEIKYVNNESK